MTEPPLTWAAGAVTATVAGPVATVRFVHPDRPVNPLSVDVLHGLADAARTLARLPGLAVTVLTGSAQVFSAGFDLKSAAVGALAHSADESDAERTARAGGEAIDAWSALPAVSIAAIEGYALGGGLVLALACDFRVARTGARLALPEIDRGLTPGWGAVPRLVAIAGLQAARRLVLLGDTLDAEAAASLQLVDRIAEAGTPALAAAQALAAQLAAKPALPLRMNKRLLNATGIDPLGSAAALDVDQFMAAARAAAFRAEQRRFDPT